jgi:hypothetical protein
LPFPFVSKANRPAWHHHQGLGHCPCLPGPG